MLGIQYWAFLLPIVTAGCWLTDIIGLLVLWSRDGFPQYVASDASIVFISDVGAVHNTWFIIFSVLTAVFYISTAFAERYLRSARRIPGSVKKRQTVYDIISVILACFGALFLGLLSGFNDREYGRQHWVFTLFFILCTGLSVVFQTLELFSLSHHHNRQVKHLKINAFFKAFLVLFALVVIICFVALYATCSGDAPGLATNTRCNRIVSAAGVFEWACAFLLFFFFLSYVVDLFPRNYYGKQEAIAEKRAHKHGGVDPEMGDSYNQNYQGQYSVDPYVHGQQDAYGTVSSTQPPSMTGHPRTEAPNTNY